MPASRNVSSRSDRFEPRRSRRLSRQEPGQNDSEAERVDLTVNSRQAEKSTLSTPLDDSPILLPSSESALPEPPSSAGYQPSTTSHSRRNSIPRPPNAFILFRSHVWKVLKEKQDEGSQKINLADVSKNVGGMWAKLPKEEQEKWKQEALSVKAQHAARFPGYHYAPTLKKARKARKTSKARSSIRAKATASDGGKGKKGNKLGRKVKAPPTDTVKIESQTPEPSYQHEHYPNDDVKLRLPDSPVEPSSAGHFDLYPGSETFAGQYEYQGPFVSTDDIPFLDLSATVKEEAKPCVPAEDNSSLTLQTTIKEEPESVDQIPSLKLDDSLVPPSYLHVEPQFGFRPRIQPIGPDTDQVPDYSMHLGSVGEMSFTYTGQGVDNASMILPGSMQDILGLNYNYDLEIGCGSFQDKFFQMPASNGGSEGDAGSGSGSDTFFDPDQFIQFDAGPTETNM